MTGREHRTVLAVATVHEEPRLSLAELGDIARVHTRSIVALVREGALQPSTGESVDDWQFPASAVARLGLAMRLRRELQLGITGTALALDLLEEVQRLRNRVSVLEGMLEPRGRRR